MRFVLITTAVATLLASACAPMPKAADAETGAATATRCFRTETIRNFRADRQSDLYVRSGRDNVFQINTNGACWDLNSAHSLAIVPALGGSNTICVGDMVRIVVPRPLPGQGVCRASVVKSLTAEEAAALPSAVRP